MIKDRTREFEAALQIKGQGLLEEPLLGNRAEERSPSALTSRRGKQHQEFTKRAFEINEGIQTLLARLDRLTKRIIARSPRQDIILIACVVIRVRTTVEDQPQETQELSSMIKTDLAKLNSRIAELQQVQRQGRTGKNLTEEHHGQIIVSLQQRLTEASGSFTSVLEEKQMKMRQERERRDQFSATSFVPPPTTSILSQRTTRSPAFGNSTNVENGPSHLAYEMPGSASGQQSLSLQQLSAPTDTTYLESRNVALQGIESAINELGAIYQQLASMISEQGETVQRIDMNIEEMQLNIERGQSELIKYMKSVTSNRWLMIKIFAVLIVFIIFFSVFLI